MSIPTSWPATPGPANEFGAFQGLIYLPCTAANGFVPEIPAEKADIVYLCYPNNPTGATATREQLAAWVEYARRHEAVILYDAAYEAYISDPAIPHSIYEIPGARNCAIEFRSFSKNAGFTGLRCAFTVMPKSLTARALNEERRPLHPLWQRRMSTKFNGVSYPVQRAAEAVYTAAGQAQVAELISHYMGNARILREACAADRPGCLRRRERALYLGRHATRDRELGHVRPHARGGEHRHHPRRWFRLERRGLFPHLRLQQPRQRRGSREADRGDGFLRRRVCLRKIRNSKLEIRKGMNRPATAETNISNFLPPHALRPNFRSSSA